MTGYKAILFAPDGDYVTDYERETKEEVIEALADRGSRWIFYPFEGVILDKGSLTIGKQRAVSIAPPLESLKGRSVKTIAGVISREDWNGYF